MFRTERPWLEVYEEGNVEPETRVFEGSLYELFRHAAEEHRGKTALSFYGTTFEFGRLQALVEKMAASLAASGVSKGDRVALMLPNCPQYVISFFATVRLGAIVTQINPMYVEREIEHILNDSGAETIVVYADVYERVKAVLPDTNLKTVIVVDFGGEPEGLDAGHHSFGDFLSTDADPAPDVEIDPAEDVAALQYTGGTTGVSKGAMLTHRNLVANVQQTIDVFVQNPDQFTGRKCVGALPFFHIYGLTCVMLFGIRLGIEQVLLPRFEVEEALAVFENDRPTMFSGVPTMYMALLASGADLRKHHLHDVHDLQLRRLGPPCKPETFLRGEGRQAPLRGLRPLRGLPRDAQQPAVSGRGTRGQHRHPHSFDRRQDSGRGDRGDRDARRRVGGADHQGPAGHEGLPQHAGGDGRDAKETAGSTRATSRRWTRDGYFYIVDRKKDMIVASGYNVYPREVEEVLFEHPDVAEAVAIGVPDEYRGESRQGLRREEVRRHDDGGGDTGLLQGAPRRLQGPQGRRVPRGVAQERRGQAPAARPGRRGTRQDRRDAPESGGERFGRPGSLPPRRQDRHQ